MRTKIEKSWDHAIVVSKEDLLALERLIAAKFNIDKIYIECVEGSEIQFESLEELLQYDNPTFRRITAVRIHFGEIFSEGGDIFLTSERSHTATFTVKSDDDDRALALATEVEKRIKEMRPWYSFVTRVPFSILAGLTGLGVGSALAWQRLISHGTPATETNVAIIDIFYLTLPIIAILIVAFIYIDRASRWLFPRTIFALGKQIREDERRGKIRNWILTGVIGSVVIAGLGKLVTALI